MAQDRISIKLQLTKALEKKRKAVKKAISETDILEKIAELIIDSLREKKFKALKPSTIAWRKKIAKTNPTHPKYAPQRSNLTLSGELIDSIEPSIIKRELTVILSYEGIHPGYFTASGGVTPKKAKANIDIARGQREGGRDILKLTKKIENEVIRLVKNRLKAEFK